MGQSIQDITLRSIGEDALKAMAENANKYILKNDFRLGEGYCEFLQRDSEILYSIIDANYCELNSILEDSIEGVGAIHRPKCKKTDSIPRTASDSGLYELWISRGNSGSMDDFLDAIFYDEKMNWYEINW